MEATPHRTNPEALSRKAANDSSPSLNLSRPEEARFGNASSTMSDGSFERYHDNSDADRAGYHDHSEGQQHEYLTQILREQDEQLDHLGESIGRQRELSLQIGDELDCQVALLDEVEIVTNRHQSRLDGATRMLRRVAKAASEKKQITAIIILIIILLLLIAILK